MSLGFFEGSLRIFGILWKWYIWIHSAMSVLYLCRQYGHASPDGNPCGSIIMIRSKDDTSYTDNFLHSNCKRPLIVELPILMVVFHNYVSFAVCSSSQPIISCICLTTWKKQHVKYAHFVPMILPIAPPPKKKHMGHHHVILYALVTYVIENHHVSKVNQRAFHCHFQ